MKRTKFIQRTVSSFLAAAMLATLASCNGLPSRSIDSGDGQTRQIVNYYTSEMLQKPEGMGYIRNMFACDGNIYLYGYKDSSSYETISGLYNMETKEMKEIPIEGIEYEYINTVYNIGSKLLIAYVAEDTYESKLALADISTGEILVDVKGTGDSYISSVSEREDGDLNVVEISYGASMKIKMKTLDGNTLETKSETDMSEKLGLSSEAYLSDVVYDEAGNIYTTVNEYQGMNYEEVTCKLYKLDPSGEIIYTVEDLDDLQGGGTVFRRANGNMCIMSSMDYENFFFNEIDNETGDVTNRYEVQLNSSDIGMLVTNSDIADILYSDDIGVWKLSVDTGKPEKILTFGEELPEKFKDCYNATYRNGEFYFYGQSYGDSNYVFSKLDRDGNILGEITVEEEDNSYINNVFVNPDGEIVLLSTVYDYSSDEYSQYNVLSVIDENGKVVTKTELTGFSDSQNAYIENIVVTKSGEYAALVSDYSEDYSESMGYAVIFDADGKLKAKLENDNISYIESYITSENGDMVYYRTKTGETVLAKVDTENWTIGEPAEIELPENAYMIGTDGNYDFCYRTSEGVYGYSAADKKSTEIINWIDSDIVYDISDVVFYDADTLLCLGYDYDINDYQVYFLKRADEETLQKIQNKKLISIAGVDIGYNTELKEKVVEFNKTNDEYRVQINDYGKYSKYEDDTYTSGAFQLNNDMTSGNVPDIIIGTSEVDMTSFASKKILADLNEYFEKDADINREDYFENILDVFTYNGKLYQITPNFSIEGIAVPASKGGTDSHWTVSEFLELKKNGNIFYKDTYRSDLVSRFITSNLSEYVDFEKKTCDFTNGNFAEIVDFIAEEGKTYDEGEDMARAYNEDDTSYYSRYKDGECQAEFMYSSVFSLLDLQQGSIGEDVTIKGLPSENGTGISVSPDTSFAICAKSKNKDAAWNFIKIFLEEDYQDSLNEDYIVTYPLRKASFETTLNKAKTEQFTQSYSVNKPDGSVADMKPLDEATASRIRAAVEAADRCVVTDERIGEIIDTALEAVFNGDSTSAAAAEEIQSKVSLYLKEIK